MQANTFRAAYRLPLRPLAALLALGAGHAWADEPIPWYVGATETLNYDSNVYRTAARQSDVYSSTGLIGGFDQPVGRQLFHAAANVHYNKYREQGTLDNTSYGVSAGWDWATIEKLSGSLSASANQSLASTNNSATVAVTSRNLMKTDQVGATARWGGTGLLVLDASLGASRVRYSAPEYLQFTANSNTASLGISYRLGPDIRVGSALRFSNTDSPYAIPLVAAPAGPDDYRSNTSKGRNLDLTLNWVATAQTGVNTRLSWTRQTNSDISDRNFSGLTGSITGSYAPTAKIGLTLAASRDAGSNASFFTLVSTTAQAPVSGFSENSQTTDSISLGATYAATAKISLTANAQFSHAKVVNSLAAAGGSTSTESTDNGRSYALGANYAVARNWQLGCNLGHVSRRISGGAGQSYYADTASCTAQFTLR